MRVLVSEYLSGGACAGLAVPLSMRREGLAMLQAVTQDLVRVNDCKVITTLERGMTAALPGEVISIDTAAEEDETFRRQLVDADAVLVIAPETDGILANRCREVVAAGKWSWNCTPAAIDLCGDKWQLFQHLNERDIPTISTRLAELSQLHPDQPWPIVLKPRDGAGSNLTFLVRDAQEWSHACSLFNAAGIAHQVLIQRFIAGRALSVGVNISLDGKLIQCLPVGEQRLSSDGRFQYQGGSIPADIPQACRIQIEDVVSKMCQSISGLAGYIGVDLILTSRGEPIIVEINPRLTTAYVGYRQLYSQPIPACWLTGLRLPSVLNANTIEFDS